MATDLSVFEDAVLSTMMEGVLTYESDMLRLTTPKVELKTKMTVRDLDGAAKFNTQTAAAAATAREVRGFSATSNPLVREARVPLRNKEYRDVLAGGGFDIGVEIGNMLSRNAMGEIADDFFTLLGAGRTTAHPENGVSGSPYAANGGGTVYFVDNFDMTGVNGDTWTQTNDHTLALSATNADTVLQKRRTYKTRDGKPWLPTVRPKLVVPPGLETLAKALASQDGRIYNGSGLEYGFSGRFEEVIVAPSGALAAAAWAVVYVTPKVNPAGGTSLEGPIYSHIRLLPTVRVAQATDGNYFNVIVEFEYDNFFAPFEGNLLYSEP